MSLKTGPRSIFESQKLLLLVFVCPFDVSGDDPNPLGPWYSLRARDSLCGSFRHRHDDAEHDDCDDDHPDEADEENGDDNIDLYLVPLIFSHVQECTPAWPEM